MYPTPNPIYGLSPVPTADVEPTSTGWDRVPQELVRYGPMMISGAIGGFIAQSVLGSMGVPSWLAWLAGAFGLGSLILRLFRRAYALTR